MGLYNVTSTPRGQYAKYQRAHRLLVAAGLTCVTAAGIYFGASPALADSSSSQAGTATPTVTLEILNANLMNVIDMLRQRSGAQFIITGDPHAFRPVNVNVSAPLPQVLEYVAESAGALITRDANGVYTIRPEGTPAPVSDLNDTPTVPQTAAPKEPVEPMIYEKIELTWVQPAFIVAVLDNADPSTINPYGTVRHKDPFTSSDGAVHMTPAQPLIELNPGQNGSGSAPGVPIAGPASTNPASLAYQNVLPPGTVAGQNPFPGQNPGGANGQVGGTLRPYGISQIVVITDQNSLLVQGTSAAIGQLRELISKLDVPAKQVEIKVEFVTATVDAIDQFGISFDLIPNPASEVSFFPTGPAAAGTINLDYAHGNLVTKLQALLTSSKGRVISSPIITCTNNTVGTVNATENLPISQTTVIAQGSGNALSSQSITYLPVSTGLSITPRINGDDSVTMVLSPQLSNVVVPPDGGAPTVSQQTIQTTRTVGNGETVVLGGLVQKTDTYSTVKVPFLADLPVIGNLFRTKNNSTDDSELLVFVTPTILPIPGSTTNGTEVAPTEGGFGVTP